MLTFFVPGVPKPGGSKTAMPIYDRTGHAVTTLTHTGKHRPVLRYVDAGNNSEWRKSVGYAAKGRVESGTPLLSCPLVLTVIFYMPRPKYHYGTGRNARVLKAGVPSVPTAPPDVTKLLRSTEDALKGVLWLDDSQIVDQHGFKRYSEHPGARITVEEWRAESERTVAG